MDYSPLAGGFAIVFNDGRAAVLTASTLKFDPNVSFYKYFSNFQHQFGNFVLEILASTRHLGA